MKKTILVLLLVSPFLICSAQRKTAKWGVPTGGSCGTVQTGFQNAGSTSRTTGIGDTTVLMHIGANDTMAVYPVGTGYDSGFYTGMNYFNDWGFAERYDFNSSDSSLTVLGVYALFTGKVNPASADSPLVDSAVFKIWDQSAPLAATTNFAYSGYPGNVLDTVSVHLNQLGIGTTSDTLKQFLFATPFQNLSVSFFAGVVIYYNFFSLNGDTIAVQCTKNGERTSPVYWVDTTISGADTTYDTTVNVQNATLWADGNWYDDYTQNDSLLNNLAIYPIVVSGNATGIKGITRNDLTFYGNYPNPASIGTHIRFSLAVPESVSLVVTDMAGHTVKSEQLGGLPAGEHLEYLDTRSFASGTYFYLVRTATGAGFGGKLDVVK